MSRPLPPTVLRLRTARQRRVLGSGRTARLRARVLGLLVLLVDGAADWNRRARDTRLLSSFSDDMLRDIGIDRIAVENDSTSSPWRMR